MTRTTHREDKGLTYCTDMGRCEPWVGPRETFSGFFNKEIIYPVLALTERLIGGLREWWVYEYSQDNKTEYSNLKIQGKKKNKRIDTIVYLCVPENRTRGKEDRTEEEKREGG